MPIPFDYKFPADTPRVIATEILDIEKPQMIVIDGSQFEDGLRRIVVPRATPPETVAKMTTALEEHEARLERIEQIMEALRNL